VCGTTCSTWSLLSHSSTSPSFSPFPYSFMIPMFLLSWINNIAYVRNSNRSFSYICRDNELSCVSRSRFKNSLLLRHWERRIETINNMTLRYLSLNFFLVHHLILILTLLVRISTELLLKHCCYLMNFIFTS